MRLYEGRLVGRHTHTITPRQLHQAKDVNLFPSNTTTLAAKPILRLCKKMLQTLIES